MTPEIMVDHYSLISERKHERVLGPSECKLLSSSNWRLGDWCLEFS